jgi:hypothetical protein
MIEMTRLNESHALALEQKVEEHRKAVREIDSLRLSIVDLTVNRDDFLRKMMYYYEERCAGNLIAIERFHDQWVFRGDWYKDERLAPTMKILSDTFEFDIWGKKYHVG